MDFQSALSTAGLVIEFELETTVDEQGAESPWATELREVNSKLTQLKTLLFGGSPPSNGGNMEDIFLTNLESEFSAEAAAFDQAIAALVDSNNRPIYAQAEHDRRRGQAMNRLQQAVQKISTFTGQAISEAQQSIALASNGDPTLLLSSKELESANQRRAFVEEDCLSLPLLELATRLQAILAGGDKATAWLYLRYAERRHQQIKNELRSTDVPAATKALRSEGLEDVRLALAALREKMFPGQAEAEHKAKESLTRAQTLQSAALRKLRVADGRDAAAKAELRNMIRSAM